MVGRSIGDGEAFCCCLLIRVGDRSYNVRFRKDIEANDQTMSSFSVSIFREFFDCRTLLLQIVFAIDTIAPLFRLKSSRNLIR